MTWAELVVEYQRWKEHNDGAAPATVRKYAGYLDRLADWYRTPPEDPQLRPAAPAPPETTIEDLELFSGLVAHHAGIGPRARKPLVAALKDFYRWAHARGRLSSNPAARLVYPEGGRRLPDAATIDSAEKLIMQPDLNTFLGLRDAAIIAVIIGTGIRVSGLTTMNEGSLVWTSHGGHDYLDVVVTEKGGNQRMVPVPEEAAVLLRAYRAHPDLAAIDRELSDGERVLWVTTMNRNVSPDKYHGERRRISPWSVGDLFRRHGRRAGIPEKHRHPHAYRHLYGTELAEADVDLLMRQSLMGHADPKSTEIYTHLAARKRREAVEKGNPLRRMRAPILDSARQLARQRKKT